MQSFNLTLSNKATLAGRHNLPTRSPSSPKHRPLVIGLHDGTFTSEYFDVDAQHTAALTSNALGIPFVAIDRPCYGGTTSFYPIPDGSSFPEELGTWLHCYILPALWTKFGEPAGCVCIVLDAHSFGAPGAVIAAALHAKDCQGADAASYPLGGVIISGFGTQPPQPGVDPLDGAGAHINFPLDVKDRMTLPPGTADAGVYAHMTRLNHLMPVEEFAAMRQLWLDKQWRAQWSEAVTVPVMIAIAGAGIPWKATAEHLAECVSIFPASVRVDGSIVPGAPHAMELSYWGQGWYARCFGFAMECAASFAIGKGAVLGE